METEHHFDAAAWAAGRLRAEGASGDRLARRRADSRRAARGLPGQLPRLRAAVRAALVHALGAERGPDRREGARATARRSRSRASATARSRHSSAHSPQRFGVSVRIRDYHEHAMAARRGRDRGGLRRGRRRRRGVLGGRRPPSHRHGVAQGCRQRRRSRAHCTERRSYRMSEATSPFSRRSVWPTTARSRSRSSEYRAGRVSTSRAPSHRGTPSKASACRRRYTTDAPPANREDRTRAGLYSDRLRM